MQIFLMSESLPAEIQTEISLLSIVQAAVIMLSSQQTADLISRQDRGDIDIGFYCKFDLFAN